MPMLPKRRPVRKPYPSSNSLSVTVVLIIVAVAFVSLPVYIITRVWTPSLYLFHSFSPSTSISKEAAALLLLLLPYEGGKGLLPFSDRRTQWLQNIDNTIDIVPQHMVQIVSSEENPGASNELLKNLPKNNNNDNSPTEPVIANIPYIALIRYTSTVPICTKSELWSNWRVCLDEYTGTLGLLPSSMRQSKQTLSTTSGTREEDEEDDNRKPCIIYSVSLDEYDSADLRYEYTAADQGCEVHYFNPRHNGLLQRSWSDTTSGTTKNNPVSLIGSLEDNAVLYDRTSTDPVQRTNPYNPYAAPPKMIPFSSVGTITIHHILLSETNYAPDELLQERHRSTLREEQLWIRNTLPTVMERLHHSSLSALKLHIRGLEWSFIPACLQTPLCYGAINQWHITYFLDSGRLIHGSGNHDNNLDNHGNLQNNQQSNHLFITTEPSLKEITQWKETLQLFDITHNPFTNWLNFDTRPYAGSGDAPWIYYTTDELYISSSSSPYTAIKKVLSSVHAAPGRIPAMYFSSYIHRNLDTIVQMKTRDSYLTYSAYIHRLENQVYCQDVNKLLKEAKIDENLFTIDTRGSIPCGGSRNV